MKTKLTGGFLHIKSYRWRFFDLLAHYTIFLPEFVKFRLTCGFAVFYKKFSHFDNRVIIFPEEAKLVTLLGKYKSNSLNLSSLAVNKEAESLNKTESSKFLTIYIVNNNDA